RRLATLPIPDDARAVIGQALTWAWKDEEMHVVYVRGTLLRLAGLRLRLMTLARQAAGALGGWSASVRQHVRWREAPLSRGADTGLNAPGNPPGPGPPASPRWAACWAGCRARCARSCATPPSASSASSTWRPSARPGSAGRAW